MLFVARVIDGLSGGNITTARAYIADVTEPEKRAAAFGLLDAAFGLGFIIGPAAGGMLGTYDPRLPFWVAAVFSLLNGCYGLFVLPESLPPERRAPFLWRSANPLGPCSWLSTDVQKRPLNQVVFACELSLLVRSRLP